FSSSTNAKDLEKKKAGKKSDEYVSDVRVITHPTYRQNGGGYNDPLHPSHIWVVALPTESAGPLPEPRQLTPGDLAHGPPTWSRDGSLLYYLFTPSAEPDYVPSDNDLYAVPAAGGAPEKVVDIDGPINDFSLSPDGARIAFLGFLNPKPVRSYDQ